MDRYARLRMLLWRKQMSASAIYPKDEAILPTLLGDRDGAKRRAGASSQGNSDPTRRNRCDEHGGCLWHALRRHSSADGRRRGSVLRDQRQLRGYLTDLRHSPHPARRRRRGERGGVHGQRSLYRSPDDFEGDPPWLQHLIDPALSQPLSAKGGRHPMWRRQPLRASYPRDPRQAAEGRREDLSQRRGRGCDRHHKGPGAEGGHNETLKSATPSTSG